MKSNDRILKSRWASLPARCTAFLLLAVACCQMVVAEEAGSKVKTLTNIPYKAGNSLSDYEKQRCLLDVYLPENQPGFATLVWFHGGGLTGGNKDGGDTQAIARSLARVGVGVVVPNYRLSPKATYPAYIQDGAAAVAWTQAHIAEHGGNANRLFIGGHSAGGYLTLMLGMDTHYLADAGVKMEAIAGLIPVSGQAMTHYTIRGERGKPDHFTVTADEAAPVHFTRKDTPPMLVIYADQDMAARAEENAYLVAILKGAGNKRVTGMCISGRNHGTVASKIAEEGDPARVAILEFIKTAGVAER